MKKCQICNHVNRDVLIVQSTIPFAFGTYFAHKFFPQKSKQNLHMQSAREKSFFFSSFKPWIGKFFIDEKMEIRTFVQNRDSLEKRAMSFLPFFPCLEQNHSTAFYCKELSH